MSRFDTVKHVATNVRGGANFLELGSILARGHAADVTPTQFKAMHPSLCVLSDAEVTAFAKCADLAFRGEIYSGKVRLSVGSAQEPGPNPA